VSGRLDTTMGGPPVMLKAQPDGVQVVSDANAPNGDFRRSVYVLARRTYPLTFLGAFDYPVIDTNCARRIPSATPLQSLIMMNDEFVVRRASDAAIRVNGLTGEDAPVAKKIETLYSLAFARKPSALELGLCHDHLKKQREVYLNANLTPRE